MESVYGPQDAVIVEYPLVGLFVSEHHLSGSDVQPFHSWAFPRVSEFAFGTESGVDADVFVDRILSSANAHPVKGVFDDRSLVSFFSETDVSSRYVVHTSVEVSRRLSLGMTCIMLDLFCCFIPALSSWKL